MPPELTALGLDCLRHIFSFVASFPDNASQGMTSLARCCKSLCEPLQPWLVDQRQIELQIACKRIGFDASAPDECAQRRHPARDIARVLRASMVLLSLDMEDVKIDDDGASAIGRALEANSTTLRFLSLHNNYITTLGPHGAKAISKALRRHSALTELRLSCNCIRAEGAKGIGEALRENTTLTKLDMAQCGIETPGAIAIAEALRHHNSTLRLLDVSSNGIGPEGGLAFSSALEANEVIVGLTMRNNSLGAVTEHIVGSKHYARLIVCGTTTAALGRWDKAVSLLPSAAVF